MKRSSSLAMLCTAIPAILSICACTDTTPTTQDGVGGRSAGTGGGATAGSPTIAGASSSAGSSGSLAGSGGNAGAAGQGGGDLLIDDFEDGDDTPLVPGGWYGYTDSGDGGKSTLSFTGATGTAVAMNGVGFESTKSLEVSYALDQGTLTYEPFIGFGVSIGQAANPYDLSAYAGISYTYQGSAHKLRVETTEVTDYDVYGVNVPASSTWKTVHLAFTSLSQENWGKKVDFVPSHVTNLSFAARGATGATGQLKIDNLKAIKVMPNTGPDMAIRPPTPPADAVIASIEIPNPLQAKAARYLTRGYNITNWLEQSRFASFTYDESFIAKLAAAGFQSLRLPIDLDNYVETRTGTGDSLAITLHPDLFTILDAFDAWTKKHGLSLTIDYHQYATLLDKSDPDSIGTAIQLWGKVAEHFSTNDREDIFFELLNEPELSFGDNDPTQAEWTAIAERMIAAIRATDKTHSIIFGDVEWYGIGPLSRRTLLSDPNVIYVFHYYEPFIFTHQGASWTSLSSVRNLPYPYSAERWSEYYADLGFHAVMEPWVLSAAKSYYRDGSKAALRNRVIDVKKWAVTNNVPVICNEFGAYDLTSRLEDRARYYTDLIGIFEELAIPWQHWFMIMNAEGVVIPEYATAMHLGQ